MAHFLLGAVGSVGVVVAVQPGLQNFWGLAPPSPQHAFLLVGPLEELAKFLPVLILYRIRPAWFSHPAAWIVACASAGGGFGMTETLMKLSRPYNDPYHTLVSVTSGLFHPIVSGMVGWCIARVEGGRIPAAAGGLALAALLHGFWNALAYKDLEWVCLLAMIFAIWFCVRNLGRLFPEEANQPVSSSSAPPT